MFAFHWKLFAGDPVQALTYWKGLGLLGNGDLGTAGRSLILAFEAGREDGT